jgi:predicted phage tail protein
LTYWQNSSAVPGTTYFYKVTAHNDCGESAQSSYASGYRLAAPATPTGINATDGQFCDYVAITWNSVAGATEYELFRATSLAGPYGSLGTISSTYWENSSATPMTMYYYRVRALNTCGSSDLSGLDIGFRKFCP